MKRYFYPGELKEQSEVRLDGEEFHHLKNVMRTRVGEVVCLFNKTKVEAEAEVISFGKDSCLLKIKRTYENEREPAAKLTLFQAVCKGDKLSLITQKITELGASEMVVFYSQFTDIKDKTSKLEKLDKVSIAACKQCGRSCPVKVSGVISFEKMLELAKEHKRVFAFYENENKATLADHVSRQDDDVAIIVGSEGGFSQDEVCAMKEAGFEIVSLGKRILRTETAAIAGTAVVMMNIDR